MDDNDDCLMSFCADLVTLRKTESFPFSLSTITGQASGSP